MKDYTSRFGYKLRHNTENDWFYFLKGDYCATDPLQVLIRDVHQRLFWGALPNDWIYKQIYYAFERLAECADDKNGDGFASVCQDIEPDVYTCDLLEWAKSTWTQAFIDEVLDEYTTKPEGIYEILSNGQRLAIRTIYEVVWDWMLTHESEAPNA